MTYSEFTQALCLLSLLMFIGALALIAVEWRLVKNLQHLESCIVDKIELINQRIEIYEDLRQAAHDE